MFLLRVKTQNFLLPWSFSEGGVRERQAVWVLMCLLGRGLLSRSHIEENQRVARRRRFPFARERSDSTGSSSIYFTASSGAALTDAESEGG